MGIKKYKLADKIGKRENENIKKNNLINLSNESLHSLGGSKAKGVGESSDNCLSLGRW